MALASLTIACFLFYFTSKYFPARDREIVERHKGKLIALASAIMLVSLYLFSADHDLTTAIVVWWVALMTLLSSIILSVKMNRKWIWVWGAICILFIWIDLS